MVFLFVADSVKDLPLHIVLQHVHLGSNAGEVLQNPMYVHKTDADSLILKRVYAGCILERIVGGVTLSYQLC